MGFRIKLKELAENSGLFVVDSNATPRPAEGLPEDPLAAMERLVQESRARVPQPPPEAFSTPPVKSKPSIKLGTPVRTPQERTEQVSGAQPSDPIGPIEIDGPPEMLAIDQVYKRAKLVTTPETGTVLKVIVLTADPNLSALPRDTKAAMVRAALAADRTAAEAIIDDAISRDRALDKGEDALGTKVFEFRERANQKVAELEAERERMLADFDRRIAALRQASDRTEDELASWRRTKSDIERVLFDAVSMVIPDGSANPITLGNAPTSQPK
jgi:hypothetical protein